MLSPRDTAGSAMRSRESQYSRRRTDATSREYSASHPAMLSPHPASQHAHHSVLSPPRAGASRNVGRLRIEIGG